MTNVDFIGAFVIGLVGAGHCIGMCGGVAAAMSLGIPKHKAKWPYLLLYNLGRITSYTIAGALIGGAVASILAMSDLTHQLAVLRLFAAVMMLLLAAYLAHIWNGLSYIERVGGKLWQRVSPLSSKLLPLKSPTYALPFGLLWGWLPCGLVYSALSWSAVAGSASGGALIMFGFGLGTLPAMITVGALAERIKPILNNRLIRLTCATLMALYGVYTAYGALKLLL
ncbi:sulfite exporter TauE/SafE family protein [Salinivibrio sp. SS2]|uniref:sulfite exporter TauE/SafE family protein n=1 Tax=Salinivibrio sp. SS2 TaxID=1892894 RepID=UPI00084CDBD9|nr:sulfite exporter TauE/SafE family protein [Salinivibrio sp. DV]ODQ00774.1 cytochrome biogenesis protein [Salinivibrio sp. DV]